MPPNQLSYPPNIETQPAEVEEYGALTQLRALLAQPEYHSGSRLPPERSLCETLGVTRAALRKALAHLEAEGQIWRHVGRGTFVGPGASGTVAVEGAKAIAAKTSPADIMEARLALEPELARLAALHATANDFEQMALCIERSKAATEWRVYETWDNRLHKTIAEATHNALLMALADTLTTVRRTVVWGRLRVAKPCPEPDHHSYAEHDALVQAIRDRDMNLAAHCMRTHLQSVRRNLLASG